MNIYQILVDHNRPWSVREIFCFFVLLVLVVCVVRHQLKLKKIVLSQAVAVVALFIFLSIVLASTVFTRTPSVRRYELMPFWSWRKVFFEHHKWLLQDNILNIILFMPIGGLLFFISRKIRWYHALIFSFGVSFMIEISQLILKRGLFEWDDMIHNTLGCLIGYGIMRLFGRKG